MTMDLVSLAILDSLFDLLYRCSVTRRNARAVARPVARRRAPGMCRLGRAS
jgi:hypothetical protein